jgi:hypothetical protein
MKKKYLSILLTGLISVSCSDFLDEEPKSQMATEQFFTDRDHAFSAVNGLYRTGVLQLFDGSAYAGSPAMFITEMSGFFDNQYKGQEVHVGYAQQLTLTGTNISGYLDDRWYDLYNGIARANLAIKNLATTPDLSEDEISQLEGEARFFRAYGYYFLVRMFGDVPLITEPAQTLADELYVGRSSVAAVYDQIVEDLQFCVNESKMINAPMADTERNKGGRITKGAAATVLAEVYLTMSGYPLQSNHYGDALAMAKRIIAGEFGAYSLTQHDMDGGSVDTENSAYNKIRRADKTASEYMLFREYEPAITTGEYARWSVPAFAGLEDKIVKYSVVNGAYIPVKQFVWMYDSLEDLRIQEKQYFHTSIVTPAGQTIDLKVRTPHMWFEETALFQTGNSGKDVPLYTYSDVLLIAAEAAARTTGVPDAVPYLAEVRARAYWKQDLAEVEADLTGLGVDAFVEQVWTERNRELVFEFKTWFDILRTRKYPQTTLATRGTVTYVNVETATNPWGKKYSSTYLLLPLSDAERQRNPALGDNNPGY